MQLCACLVPVPSRLSYFRVRPSSFHQVDHGPLGTEDTAGEGLVPSVQGLDTVSPVQCLQRWKTHYLPDTVDFAASVAGDWSSGSSEKLGVRAGSPFTNNARLGVVGIFMPLGLEKYETVILGRQARIRT
jgi:hypothetical protein